MTLTSKTFVWWDNISENTSLQDFIRLVNRRRVKLDLSAGTSTAIGTGPAGLPDCLLWWRAHDLLLTKTEGDTVAFIPDASQSGNHGYQTSGAREPTMKLSILNGYPVLEFGGEDHLISGDVVQATDGTTLYVVMKRSGAFLAHGCFAGFGQAVASGGTTPADSPAIVEQTSGNIEFFDTFPTGTGTDSHYSTVGTPTTSWSVVTLNFVSTSSGTAYRNGTLGSTFDPPSLFEGSNFQRFFCGAGNGSGIWYGANCQIAEAVWFNGSHSSADRQTVEGFLMDKYAL